MEVRPAVFADMAGVTKQAISAKIKSKTLILNSAGRLDTENPVNAMYLSGRRRKSKDAAESAAVAAIALPKAANSAPQTDTEQRFGDESDIAFAAGVPQKLLGLTMKQIVMNYSGLPGFEKHAKMLKDVMIAAEKEHKMKERSLAFIKKDFVTSRLFSYIDVLMKQLFEYPESITDEVMALAIAQGAQARPHIITKMKQGLEKVIDGSKNQIIKELEGLKEKYSSSDTSVDKIKEAISEEIEEAQENAD